jgi:hypothetical protein
METNLFWATCKEYGNVIEHGSIIFNLKENRLYLCQKMPNEITRIYSHFEDLNEYYVDVNKYQFANLFFDKQELRKMKLDELKKIK